MILSAVLFLLASFNKDQLLLGTDVLAVVSPFVRLKDACEAVQQF